LKRDKKMLCPKCKAEFEPHVTVCGACNVTLVDQLPTEPDCEFRELARAIVCHDRGQLAIAESLLQASEIPYHVPREGGASFLAVPRSIVVPIEFLEEATEILAPLAEPVPGDPNDDSVNDVSDLR
jgi:hypothetical protein